eukprot:6469875-Amphidinium_carterae.1
MSTSRLLRRGLARGLAGAVEVAKLCCQLILRLCLRRMQKGFQKKRPRRIVSWMRIDEELQTRRSGRAAPFSHLLRLHLQLLLDLLLDLLLQERRGKCESESLMQTVPCRKSDWKQTLLRLVTSHHVVLETRKPERGVRYWWVAGKVKCNVHSLR